MSIFSSHGMHFKARVGKHRAEARFVKKLNQCHDGSWVLRNLHLSNIHYFIEGRSLNTVKLKPSTERENLPTSELRDGPHCRANRLPYICRIIAKNSWNVFPSSVNGLIFVHSVKSNTDLLNLHFQKPDLATLHMFSLFAKFLSISCSICHQNRIEHRLIIGRYSFWTLKNVLPCSRHFGVCCTLLLIHVQTANLWVQFYVEFIWIFI